MTLHRRLGEKSRARIRADVEILRSAMAKKGVAAFVLRPYDELLERLDGPKEEIARCVNAFDGLWTLKAGTLDAAAASPGSPEEIVERAAMLAALVRLESSLRAEGLSTPDARTTAERISAFLGARPRSRSGR